VFQRAAAGLDAGGIAGAFHGDAEGDFFVFGHLVEIQMKDLVGKNVALNLLDDGKAAGLGVALNSQVEEDVFGGGAMNRIADVEELDFKALGLVVLAVNDGGDATGGAKGFATGAAAKGSREGA
jgi:hypothetical protein